MTIKQGDTLYKVKSDKRKYHVVTILVDEPEPQVVLKYFGLHKKWWHYEIESLYGIETSLESGLYSLKKSGRTIALKK